MQVCISCLLYGFLSSEPTFRHVFSLYTYKAYRMECTISHMWTQKLFVCAVLYNTMYRYRKLTSHAVVSSKPSNVSNYRILCFFFSFSTKDDLLNSVFPWFIMVLIWCKKYCILCNVSNQLSPHLFLVLDTLKHFSFVITVASDSNINFVTGRKKLSRNIIKNLLPIVTKRQTSSVLLRVS